MDEQAFADQFERILNDLDGPSKFALIYPETGDVFFICRRCDARRRREADPGIVRLCPNCARQFEGFAKEGGAMFTLWAWLVNRKPFSWAYDLAFAIVARLRRRNP